MSNYPDDIRNFDSDPSSPFYSEGPTCSLCEEPLEDDGEDWCCVNSNCPHSQDYNDPEDFYEENQPT